MTYLAGKTYFNFLFPLLQSYFWVPKSFAQLTEHLNLLDLNINYDIASNHPKKNLEIRSCWTIYLQNQTFNNTGQFIRQNAVWCFCIFKNHSELCSFNGYNLIRNILSLVLQALGLFFFVFLFGKTATCFKNKIWFI